MKTTASPRPLVATLVLLAACASSPSEGSAPGPEDHDVITRAEIDRSQWTNTYDLVSNLRPQWVRTRGIDSVHNPGEVQVYIDGTRLGGVELLRGLSTSAIDRLEWVGPVEAAGRWGLNHGHGVIAIYYSPKEDS